MARPQGLGAYEAHIEQDNLGGRRVFVVLTIGRKHVRAFVPSIMETRTIGRDLWERSRPIPLDAARIARIIRRKRRQWARLFPKDETAQRWRTASAAALETLEMQTKQTEIPGAEPSAQQAQESRDQRGRVKGRKMQQPCDVGLFAPPPQPELFDKEP